MFNRRGGMFATFETMNTATSKTKDVSTQTEIGGTFQRETESLFVEANLRRGFEVSMAVNAFGVGKLLPTISCVETFSSKLNNP